MTKLKSYVRDELILYSQTVYHYQISDETDKSKYYATNNLYEMYSGDTITDEKRKYILNRMFHKEKDKMWKQIQFVDNIQNKSQIGFILHGPPGTGKSRFAYTMAIATQRHIISLDFPSLSRKSVYQIFKSPNVNGKNLKPSNVIFVFDEFDQTIIALQEKEVQNKKKMETKVKMLEDLIESKNSSLLENIDLNGYKKDSDNIKIGHLLEMIQGPVPLTGAIFIATTNNFEQINKICPALFRAGRLTPIYFGHAEYDILQEISTEYYKKRLNIPKNTISTICTSEIITFINQHQLDVDYDFQEFENFILKNINKNCEPNNDKFTNQDEEIQVLNYF
jgi:SpoVK/Ycf46/Vps4 family AAA+-type ATPase